MISHSNGKIHKSLYFADRASYLIWKDIINKNSIVENLQQLSLKVQRCVYDTLIAIDAKPHNFQITNALVVKSRQAQSQYMGELEKK